MRTGTKRKARQSAKKTPSGQSPKRTYGVARGRAGTGTVSHITPAASTIARPSPSSSHRARPDGEITPVTPELPTRITGRPVSIALSTACADYCMKLVKE